ATVMLQVPPPPSTTVSQPSVTIVKSAAFGPLIVAVPGVRKPPPVLVMVMACVDAFPIATVPNSTGVGPTTAGVAGAPAAPTRSSTRNVSQRLQFFETGSLPVQKRRASMFQSVSIPSPLPANRTS